MNRRQSFISDMQSAELMQPRDGALDHPSRLAKIAAMTGATPCDLMPDTSASQRLPMGLAVVATIGLYAFGLAKRRPAFSGNGRNTVEQRHALRDIVPIQHRYSLPY